MVCISSALLCAMYWNFYQTDTVYCGIQHTDNCLSIWKDVWFIILFVCLCFTNSVASLFSVASSIAVERDWVVVLTQGDDTLLTGR